MAVLVIGGILGICGSLIWKGHVDNRPENRERILQQRRDQAELLRRQAESAALARRNRAALRASVREAVAERRRVTELQDIAQRAAAEELGRQYARKQFEQP